jgi:hypothetical protein
VRLSISAGIHGIGMRGVELSDEFKAEVQDALKELQEKHEEKLLASLCSAIGWPKGKADAAAAVRKAEEKALLDADSEARRKYRERRAKARV